MTTFSIGWRLFWKEYRLQRALWIAMAAIAVLVQILSYGLLPPHDRFPCVFGIACVLPAFYFLGCGAMLFAGERETGTYEFQRMLPVRAITVFCVKAAFGVVSAAAMAGLTMLFAFALTGWTREPSQDFAPFLVAAGFALCGVWVFLWAVFFSLISCRVVPAAILGITAASTSAFFAVSWVRHYDNLIGYEWAAILALVTLVDLWLGSRWFRERGGRPVRSAQDVFFDAMPSPATSVALEPIIEPSAVSPSIRSESSAWPCFGALDRSLPPDRIATLTRLVWQHWRQSRRLIFILVAIIFALPFRRDNSCSMRRRPTSAERGRRLPGSLSTSWL
jgi:hypothetical protein